jgi:predicted nucleotidyltransferase
MADVAREELSASLRSPRPELEREGVTSLVLFASRPWGDTRIDSDIAVMIDVAEGRKFSSLVGLPASIFMRRTMDLDFLAEGRGSGLKVF